MKIQVVGEQGIELNTQQAAFGQQGALLLHKSKKMRSQRGIGKYHRFPQQRAHLCATDIKCVAGAGDERQGHIRIPGCQAIAHAGAVQVQKQAVFPADFMETLKFAGRVQGTVFRGMGQINHPRANHMVPVFILKEGLQIPGGIFRIQLSPGMGQGQYLVAARLDGPGLVGVDMAAVGAQHALPGLQQAFDYHRVGLGSPRQKMNGRLPCATEPADLLFGPAAVFVAAVTGHFFQIGPDQRFQHGRMRAFQIITFKMKHKQSSCICNSSAFRLHCHKSMHTGCVSRSLAPAGLGIPLQKQRDTSRDSGRLSCNFYLHMSFNKFIDPVHPQIPHLKSAESHHQEKYDPADGQGIRDASGK